MLAGSTLSQPTPLMTPVLELQGAVTRAYNTCMHALYNTLRYSSTVQSLECIQVHTQSQSPSC